MKYNTILVTLLILTSCTKDTGSGTLAVQFPNYELIGLKDGKLYQYSYNSNQKEGQLFNLESQFGLQNDQYYLYHLLASENSIGLIAKKSPDKYSYYGKNITSGHRVQVINFLKAAEEDVHILKITASDSFIATVYVKMEDYRDGVNEPYRLFIKTTEISSGSSQDLEFGQGRDFLYDPLIIKDYILIPFFDDLDSQKIAVVSYNSNEVVDVISISNSSAIFQKDEDKIAIIPSNTLGGEYMEYVLSTGKLQDRPEVDLDFYPNPGGNEEGVIINDRLNYLSQPGPGRVGRVPYFVNFADNQVNILDIFKLDEPLREQGINPVRAVSCFKEIAPGTFMIGVNHLGQSEGEGVLISNRDVTNWDYMATPIFPLKLFIDN